MIAQEPPLSLEDRVLRLRRSLINELAKAMALPDTDRVRGLLDAAFGRGVQRVSRLFWEFDREVALHGTAQGARWLLQRFVTGFAAKGAENIPHDGPLLLVANHPAAYDSIVISACVERPDYKIIIGDIPPFYQLPNLCEHAIFSPDEGNTHGRMQTVRMAIQHLKDGGALLIFPRGGIEPDPDCMPAADAEFGKWSRSVELFLRHVPQTKLLATIVSGVISPAAMRHPITWLRKTRVDRQRLAFMIQILRQIWSGEELYGLTPRVTFGDVLSGLDHAVVAQEVEQAARRTLALHMAGG